MNVMTPWQQKTLNSEISCDTGRIKNGEPMGLWANGFMGPIGTWGPWVGAVSYTHLTLPTILLV